MESLAYYIPMDRRQALARGQTLPDRTSGAALFADISGFTALSEALVKLMGPQRGAEELTRQLRRVFDPLIAEVERYGGSVISFSGDAITCWFNKDMGERTTAAALAMQQTIKQFTTVTLPSGDTLSLAMKVAVSVGPVRRFLVGDPNIQLIDVLAGATLARLAAAEHLARKGEVVLDPATNLLLADQVHVSEWRTEVETDDVLGIEAGAILSDESEYSFYREGFIVVTGLKTQTAPNPWPPLPAGSLSVEQMRPWVLPTLFERIQKVQDVFLAELRPVAVLFLRFTGIDYDDDPAAGAKLDRYIQWVQQTISRYDGALLQLIIGDKGSYLYVAFGAPIAHDDDAARAASAALALRHMPAELDFIQSIHIGISRGRMSTGPYGGANSRTYGVLGDEVNLAARLMQAAGEGQIIASERVVKLTTNAFEWQALPPVNVKGKTGLIHVFALEAAKTRQTIRLQEPSYTLPMVGREAECALITEKLSHAAQGHGQIISIIAEAGMGKSRLVAATIKLANAHGFEGYGGDCQSYGTHTAYLVWHNIWRTFFNLNAAQPVAEQIKTLESELARIDPSFVRRMPLLEPALNLMIPDNDLTQTFDAQLRKASLEALLVDCLKARLAAQDGKPLLIVLEDMHWLDPLSRDLLETIARAMAHWSLALVLAYRPSDGMESRVPPLAHLPYHTEIRLRYFNAEEARQLIGLKMQQLLGETTTLPEVLLERLTARASGNPFYIEELLNYLHDRGLDPRDVHALEKLEWPDSLHSLILSRIDQLSESQKITIKVASIIGRLFQIDWLWGVYPRLGSAERIAADLEALPEEMEHLQADLDVLHQLDLTPMDAPVPVSRYMFKHIVTQEVAYESQPFATRVELHERFGQFLEQSYAQVLLQMIDLLAYHYGRSQNKAKQREYFRRAGEAAQEMYANAAAMDYYQRLQPLLDEREQIEVRLKLGEVLELVGRWADAEQSYQQALHFAEKYDDRKAQARCARALGGLFSGRGDYTQAVIWLERARSAFIALGDQLGLSQTLHRLGFVFDRQGARAEARALLEEGLKLGRALNDQRGIAESLNFLGIMSYRQGDRAAAKAQWEESLALRRALGDKRGIANSLNNLGIVARGQGDYATARALQSETLALRREIGDKYNMANSLVNLGLIAHSQGDDDAARTTLEEGLGLFRELGSRSAIALALTNLGHVVLTQNDYATAKQMYQEGLVVYREIGDKYGMGACLAGLAGVAASVGQTQHAAHLAGATRGLLEAIGASLDPIEQAVYDRAIAAISATTHAAALDAALSEGKALSLEQALEAAAR